MKAFKCDHCGATIPAKEFSGVCTLCPNTKEFTEVELPDPTPIEREEVRTYEQVIERLKEYDEGSPQSDRFIEED